MAQSYVDPFRIRQTVHDLGLVMARASDGTRHRVAERAAPRERQEAAYSLARIMDRPAPRRRVAPGAAFYGAARMAAALPDDDFEGFVFATAALLLDRINGSDTPDDLHWNWDAFADHYRLADPWQRAALMNGFRTGTALGRVSLLDGPTQDDCLTVRAHILFHDDPPLGAFGQVVSDAARTEASATEAGHLWAEAVDRGAQLTLLPFFRYLYERPEGLSPPKPDNATLLPALL